MHIQACYDTTRCSRTARTAAPTATAAAAAVTAPTGCRPRSPAGPLADKLHAEIRRLPGPPLVPHVTLLGGIASASEADVLARAHALARELKVRWRRSGA